jgi:hypothetical protein
MTRLAFTILGLWCFGMVLAVSMPAVADPPNNTPPGLAHNPNNNFVPPASCLPPGLCGSAVGKFGNTPPGQAKKQQAQN